MTKQAINQHLARAEALGDDLPRVTGTSLDKGVERPQTCSLKRTSRPFPRARVQRPMPNIDRAR